MTGKKTPQEIYQWVLDPRHGYQDGRLSGVTTHEDHVDAFNQGTRIKFVSNNNGDVFSTLHESTRDFSQISPVSVYDGQGQPVTGQYGLQTFNDQLKVGYVAGAYAPWQAATIQANRFFGLPDNTNPLTAPSRILPKAIGGAGHAFGEGLAAGAEGVGEGLLGKNFKWVLIGLAAVLVLGATGYAASGISRVRG